MNQKVSIIVPVYNAEYYLEKCINCLQKQTYENLNVIFVDDGSTDNSGEICERYANQNKNFSVIHQKNQGLSGARNTGLAVADGAYVSFLDPDDWIDIDYVEKCMMQAKKYNFPDLVFTPYCREYGSKSIKNKLFKENKVLYFDQKNFVKNFYLNLFGRDPIKLENPAILDDLSPIWSKFYKKELISNVKFIDTKKIGTEDLWFNINALYKAQSAVYINNVYYHYNKQNNNSLTKNYKTYLEPGWGNLFKLIRMFITNNELGTIYNKRLDVRQGFAIITLLREVISADALSVSQKLSKSNELLNNEFYIKYLTKYKYENLSIKWKVFTYLCKKKRVCSIFLLITLLEPLKKYLK